MIRDHAPALPPAAAPPIACCSSIKVRPRGPVCVCVCDCVVVCRAVRPPCPARPAQSRPEPMECSVAAALRQAWPRHVTPSRAPRPPPARPLEPARGAATGPRPRVTVSSALRDAAVEVSCRWRRDSGSDPTVHRCLRRPVQAAMKRSDVEASLIEASARMHVQAATGHAFGTYKGQRRRTADRDIWLRPLLLPSVALCVSRTVAFTDRRWAICA